ncbi:MAG: hypothetical protein UT84_C0018G0021 [Candidatus Curtissbacteria bacterium GW2011_GWA1_40_16]|uniref:Blue (type 1) copper domain-containing protein n=1 Tax=Candidatus Curtissbacteria bacterium GW2011_GWA1_40_16 TaxID=1618405 RepID=A0A0G0TS27_9BACT|nr:MAG: hypothetical protein UT84_C0018G0021 [Candidatus Curtissbacteria bacterium GW2011_GWA1_40_16]
MEESQSDEGVKMPQTEGRLGGRLLFIIGGVVVLVVFVAGYVLFTKNREGAMALGDTNPARDETAVGTVAGDSMAREVVVDGSNFKFVPSSFTVAPGERIKLTFKDSDGFHNLVFENLGVGVNAISAGAQESTEFTAPTAAGSYKFYCSVDGHREKGMEGVMIVQ